MLKKAKGGAIKASLIDMLGRLAISILIVFVFINTKQVQAVTYITKKSDTSKIVEQIEKDYADRKITKSKCTKKKSKALKLEKVSKTICDNVKIKTAKKETKKEKKTEYIKKKKKKKKKAKKEFLKKSKDLSKKAKSWITKKVKKEKKHYKTIARLPKADWYFTSTDDKGNTFIGYAKSDQNSKTMEVGNRKFKKVSNGKAFKDDGKTQCDVRSEVDKATNEHLYTGQVLIKCPNNIFIGIWHQTGNEGFGVAQSEAGIKMNFAFSTDRKNAVASLENKKKDSKQAKKKEKSYDSKDTDKPIIKVAYNNAWFSSSEDKEVSIESGSKDYTIEGKITDNEGVEQVKLLVSGRPMKIEDDGSFKIKRSSNKSEEINLYAHDSEGNNAELFLNVKILLASSKFINDKKYYALIIGNNDYDNKEWDDLESPINDITVIAAVLKKKYKFTIPEKFILKNATKNDIEDALDSLNDILTEEDYLLIYYAGHGSRGTNVKRAYWIPIDGKSKCCRNWINTSNVTDLIGEFKAKHVLLMVDSCFSGLLKGKDENLTDDGEEKNAVSLIKWMNRKVRLYISSGSNEPVLDKGDNKHSYFAKKFIELLEENNDHITSWELFGHIDKYVQNNASQRPNHKVIKETGHNYGRFIFSARN
jgi:hypothetical protein